MKSDELVKNKIYRIREKKVMLDADLAELYQIEKKCLKEQIRKNRQRFPPDFMFQVKLSEFENLLSHIAPAFGIIPELPFAFTAMGAAMLACVLETDEAIRINIQLIRDFGKCDQGLG